MPKHHLFVMDPSAKAPAGDGDTKSWFMFYKWKVEGETFVPQFAPFFKAEPGDYIWFAFLGRNILGLRPKVLGGAKIVRIEEEHRRLEIWYRADDLFELDDDVFYEGPPADLEVPAKEAEEWLTKARRITP
jgi:hypothetical protein